MIVSFKFKFYLILISGLIFLLLGYITTSTFKKKDANQNYKKLYNAEFSDKIQETDLVKIDAMLKIQSGETFYFEIDYSKFSMKESQVDYFFENIKYGCFICKLKYKNYFTINKNGKEAKFFFK